MANGDIDVLARKIDVMHDRGNPQVDCGVRLGKPAEPVHQPFGGKIRRGAHGQHARALPLHQALGPHGDAIERIAHDGKVVAAGIGDDQPLPLAVEQLDAELGFQRFNLMTHRALRDAKLLGGAGEADMPGRGLEGFDSRSSSSARSSTARIPTTRCTSSRKVRVWRPSPKAFAISATKTITRSMPRNGSSTTRSMPIARKWCGRESPTACLPAHDRPGHADVSRKCKHWDSAEMQVAPAAQAFHRPTRCNSTAIASSRSGMLTIVERNQNPAAMRADMAPIRLRTRRARVGSKVLIFDLRNERRSAKLYPLRLRLS